MRPRQRSQYFRNFTFGVEDSLVSTVGLLSGIAANQLTSAQIIVTGLILLAVEGLSMAVGSLLTEHSADELAARREVSLTQDIPAAVIMFFSYFLTGFLPLSPYFFLSVSSALPVSVLVSLVALFVLGLINARITHVRPLRSGLQMILIGGAAVLVGVLIGYFLKLA